MQNCPVLKTNAEITVRIAVSRSASANRMLAALPPSSAVNGFRLAAASAAAWAPTSVEPVKATLSTPGWATR
ncbi:hypothetical protein QE381_001773 [Microbacterium sp. SORGH_AS 888]|nr:hypothetical protein [Microbacterium sp. SORGH_AS_0888]